MSVSSINAPYEPEQKIVPYQAVPDMVRSFRADDREVLLAQGVFDILHLGHVGYLRAARQLLKAGGVLFVGVENDASVRLNKGDHRPVNPAAHRIGILAELVSVDYVFEYDGLVQYDEPAGYIDRYARICPTAVVAGTDDPYLDLKRMQAEQANTTVVAVSFHYPNSTTQILRTLGYE